MKVWMRFRSAWASASAARSMSCAPARARPQTTERLIDLGDLRDGLEVAVGGDRKARLDDVDAHLVEELGDLDLLVERHRGAGRLLAVAQGGVEDDDAFLGGRGLFGGGHCLVFLKPCPRSERRASKGGLDLAFP